LVKKEIIIKRKRNYLRIVVGVGSGKATLKLTKKHKINKIILAANSIEDLEFLKVNNAALHEHPLQGFNLTLLEYGMLLMEYDMRYINRTWSNFIKFLF